MTHKLEPLYLRMAIGVFLMGVTMNAHASTQLYDKTVVEILHYVSYAVVKYQPAHPSQVEGCSYASNQSSVILDWSSDDNVKLQLSSVLAAQLAGRTVTFGVSGCGSFSIPSTYRVEVH